MPSVSDDSALEDDLDSTSEPLTLTDVVSHVTSARKDDESRAQAADASEASTPAEAARSDVTRESDVVDGLSLLFYAVHIFHTHVCLFCRRSGQ